MICLPSFEQHDHREKDTPSLLDSKGQFCQWQDGDVGVVFETDPSAALFGAPVELEELLVPGMVTQLLSRKELLGNQDAITAVRKEAKGLLDKGTWDLESVKELDELRAVAQKSGQSVHLAQLMSICSIKFAELAKHLQVYKGRIVFRGDIARDEWGAAAVYQELSASPTSIATANATIAYGLIPGHRTTCADAVKAYVQSELKSKQATWIALPTELWPEAWKGRYKRPMVRLIKALYGHPESGAHWQRHLEDILKKGSFKAVPVPGHPSTYWMTGSKLLLTVYVDDLMLSGPAEAHDGFWAELRKQVELEDVTGLERFLGRHHELSQEKGANTVAYDMSAYARQTVDMYVERTGAKMKRVATPFCPEGALVHGDEDELGELAPHACAILMKMLWLARLSRPDILKPIGDLATRIQKWTRNNDKQLYRLACYIHSTLDHKLVGRVGDKLSDLKLRLYADADFAGDKADAKSTNGGYLVLVGPNTFFPLQWLSRKQTSTSRSTTEAEVVALAHGVFSEAIPMLLLWDTINGGSFPFEALEDNQATIKVVKKGYSSKLRHIARTHKVNLSSLSEVFERPGSEIEYVDTKEQAADIFTKALEPQKWANALDLLGMRYTSGVT